MTKKESILYAFLSEKLNEQGHEIDDNVFRAIAAGVELEEGEPIESEETRSVYLSEDTDGKPSAKSIKWYNLMKISFEDIIGFILKQLDTFFTEDNRLKVIFSVLNLLHEFYPKLTYTFNEQDAGILLALYESGKKEFVPVDLQELYQHRFHKALSDNQLSQSLAAFKELKVVRYLGENKYAVRENMIYER